MKRLTVLPADWLALPWLLATLLLAMTLSGASPGR
jgi:hypothetical protein